MNVDLGIWSKLTKLVVFLIVVAVLGAIAILYQPEIQKNERFRKEVDRLDAQIQKEEAKEKQTRSAIETLRTDPKAVERLAREKLTYAKPGETVVRFETMTTNTIVR
jgi:cell division protein FtsB